MGYSSDEIPPHVLMIVDFSVEDNLKRAMFVRNRLITSGAIDDRQTSMTECGVGIHVVAVSVRPAVRQGRAHPSDGSADLRIERSFERDGSTTAAHQDALRAARSYCFT